LDLFDEPEPEELPTSTETPEAAPVELDEGETEARAEARAVQAELTSLTDRLAPLRLAPRLSEEAPLPEGGMVHIRRFGQEGVVLSSKGDKVEVRVGAVRITVPREECTPVESRAASEVGRLPESRRSTLSTRVDLRGLTSDEALFELDRYLDMASLAGAEKVEVIHGKGTGALRQAVHKHLKTHPMVAEQRLGEVHEGGWGVTVVKLKR
ncbi:MAG: Smr/MutS family protein, partial [Candidatus Eremiobacterota bacterium]